MDKVKKETPAAPAAEREGAGRAMKPAAKPAGKGPAAKDAGKAKPAEIGGPQGPEPTRFGDWERGGICVDF